MSQYKNLVLHWFILSALPNKLEFVLDGPEFPQLSVEKIGVEIGQCSRHKISFKIFCYFNSIHSTKYLHKYLNDYEILSHTLNTTI